MTREEYDMLQDLCGTYAKKIPYNEHKGIPNYEKGWNDAFIYMKSLLHGRCRVNSDKGNNK